MGFRKISVVGDKKEGDAERVVADSRSCLELLFELFSQRVLFARRCVLCLTQVPEGDGHVYRQEGCRGPRRGGKRRGERMSNTCRPQEEEETYLTSCHSRVLADRVV